MSSRPRRTAAQKASVAITDMADRDNMSSRARRSGDGKGFASVSRGPPSSSSASGQRERGDASQDHTYLTVKLPANKLRQATSSRQGNSISVNNEGSATPSSARRATRGVNKSYVLESESDEEEEEEGEDEIQVGAPAPAVEDDDDEDEDEEMGDLGDEDADGEVVEDEMDVDAEGEDDDLGNDDAEGEDDIDMDAVPPPRPTIKISKGILKNSPAKAKSAPALRRAPKVIPASKPIVQDDDDDDDELSELSSEDEDMDDPSQIGGMEDAEGEDDDEEMDAEGEEVDEEQQPRFVPTTSAEAGTEDLDSDDGGEAPDLSRMTVRQRARFEEIDPNQYQALSNDVQAKKVFTAEEISMRRAEMARRRRNLSEKRNEEVKMETINKLLKKQAPKTKGRALQGNNDETDEAGVHMPNPIFVRWISSKEGSRIAVPHEMLETPAGRVFGPRPVGMAPRSMIEEVS